MTDRDRINSHYGASGLLERIETALRRAGKDPANLSVGDLSPVDAFHSRGREATAEVLALQTPTASQLVLDVGCGLGGTARHLASSYGCRVVGIDLTEEFVRVGQELTRRVGLGDRVELRQGSALELPFEDETFDMAWTEHVQMNIAEKNRFYGEIARVLKPGARFLFHDIFAGPAGDLIFPLPWASEASLSSLILQDEAREIFDRVGLEVEAWESRVPQTLAYFSRAAALAAVNGPPVVSIHLLMGETAALKLQNYVENLRRDRLSVALGKARKR